MRRREFLATAGSAGLAGCSAGRFGRDAPVRLGVVAFQNHTRSEQFLGVVVSANGTVEHETSVTLPAATAGEPTSERLAGNWPERANAYTVRVESDLEEAPLTLRVAESRARTCETLLVVLRPGDVVPYRGSDGECDR